MTSTQENSQYQVAQVAKLQEAQVVQAAGFQTQLENIHRTLISLNTQISSGTGQVRITDVDIPFGTMVKLLIKYAVAFIPAVIILLLAISLITTIFGGVLLGGLLR